MTLTYNGEDNGEDNYTYTITEENEYRSLLNNLSIPIKIDSTNFDCNTCDNIFAQVFAFVNEHYNDIDLDAEFYTLHTDNKVESDNLLDILKKKATDTLQTQMNKKMTGVVDNALHENIFNGLNYVATDTLQTLMDEKMTGVESDALHKNIFNGLNHVATDTLQTLMDEKMTDLENNVLTNNIFNGLNKKATDTLRTRMDEKMTDLENNVLTDKIFNGLNDVAKRELINELNKKDVAPEVDDDDEVLTNNIFNGLKEKAMNELKNQINALPKNETAELGVIDKEQYKDDSKEYGKPLDLDKDKTKLTITINDPDNKNKKTKQQLTVKEIIYNLKKNKVPNNNPSRKYNNPKKESEKYKSKNYKKKKLIEALTNANTVGQAITILKDRQYNVDPKYNQYYNEFINTLYGRHPFSGGDNMEDDV